MSSLLRLFWVCCQWGRGILPFLATVFISILLLQLNQVQKRTFFEVATSTILYPAQSVISWIDEIKSVASENKNLRMENARLKFLFDQRQQAASENKRLREYLHIPKKTDYPLLLAEVVARDPSRLHSTVVVNVGVKDSVVKDMPVFTTKGVVGRISKVFRNHSHVLLLQDPSSKVSILESNSRTIGILESVNGKDLLVNIATHSRLNVGDTVVTSGFGGVFPKGMALGRIESFRDGPIAVLEQAIVKPFQNSEYLEEVFVLKRRPLWSVGASFE